jgi:hypothetical protein
MKLTNPLNQPVQFIMLKTGKPLLGIFLIGLLQSLLILPFKLAAVRLIKRVRKGNLQPTLKEEFLYTFKLTPSALVKYAITFCAGFSGAATAKTFKAPNNLEYYQKGGIWWFKDLSKPDPYLVLPVVLVSVAILKDQIKILTVEGESLEKRRSYNISSDSQLSVFLINLILKSTPFIALIWYRKQSSGLILYNLTYEVLDMAQNLIINVAYEV